MGDRLTTSEWARTAPAGLVGGMLLVAIWLDAAFDLRYWAPLTALALVLLATMLFAGALTLPRSRALAVALTAVWAFAAWTLLSALWAESAGRAVEGGLRTVLYASVATIAIAAVPRPDQRRAIIYGLVGGVSLIAVATLIDVKLDGLETFLAGRLNEPIGYRNATAAVLAFAVWPLVGFAARRGVSSPLRVGSFACTVLILGLILMTQSRGVVIGLVGGGVVSLLIGPDRLRRCWVAVAAVVPVAIASAPLLRPYQEFTDSATVTEASVQGAADAVILITLIAGLAAVLPVVLDNGQRPTPQFDLRFRRLAAGGLGALAVAGVAAALIAIGNPVSYADEKIDEFKQLEPASAPQTTRIGSVGGQRYDLWRIALNEFGDHPVAGVGEGNYSFDYYRERRTDRNLSDAHSLPLRLLAETGLVGALLFAAFLVAIGVCVAGNARWSGPEDRLWVAAAAAAGTTVFAQTLTDWLWLLPGLMGIGFLALGLAAPDANADLSEEDRLPLAGRLAAGAALGCVAVAALLIYFSDLYVRKAREDVISSPQQALDDARTAADLNPVSITPLYLEASALETEGDRAGARDALERALGKEPENFVTLGLLGDLEVRAGNRERAREYYRQALELNPRDVGLQELARNP